MHRCYAPLGATFLKWKSFRETFNACVSLCVCECGWLLLFVVNDNNNSSSSNIAIIFALKTYKVLIRSPTQQLNLSIYLSLQISVLNSPISYRSLMAHIFSLHHLTVDVYAFASVPLTTESVIVAEVEKFCRQTLCKVHFVLCHV